MIPIATSLKCSKPDKVKFDALYKKLSKHYKPMSKQGCTIYEMYHSDDWVRPHVDYEEYDADNHEAVLNWLCQSLDVGKDEWAISQDVRTVDDRIKHSYHMVLHTKKCRVTEWGKWVKNHSTFSGVDTKIYRNGWNKWRMPMCKKHTGDDSLMQPINYTDKTNYTKHLLTMCSENSPIPLTKKQKYTKCSNVRDLGDGWSAYNITELLCGQQHKNNHNYIVSHTDGRTYIKCHSHKCTNWYKVLVAGAKHNEEHKKEFCMQTLMNIQHTAKTEALQKCRTSHDQETDKMTKLEYRKLITDMEVEIATETYKQRRQYFQRWHFKVLDPMTYVRICNDKPILYSRQKFQEMYIEIYDAFLSQWLKDIKKRTYDTMDCLPPPVERPHRVYNLWRGFKIEQCYQEIDDPVNLDVIHKHMKILVNHDPAVYEYLYNYLAHMIQKPGIAPNVAILFKSTKEGVGKNLFLEQFIGRQIIGSHLLLQTSDLEHLVGRFTQHSNKLLVILDEASGRDTFSAVDKVKNLITADTIVHERKGIDAVVTKNFARYMFFSNNDTPLKLSIYDRRFLAIECDDTHANNHEYFTTLHKSINDPLVQNAFFQSLLTRDISQWNPRNRPQTQYGADLRQGNIPVIAQFLNWYVDDPYLYLNMTADKLFKAFDEWKSNNGLNQYVMSGHKFYRLIKRYSGVSVRRKSDGMHYSFDKQLIQEDLMAKGYWIA